MVLNCVTDYHLLFTCLIENSITDYHLVLTHLIANIIADYHLVFTCLIVISITDYHLVFIDVMGICETFLDDTIADNEICIEGYTIVKKNRNRHGGGVILYIKEGYSIPKLPI